MVTLELSGQRFDKHIQGESSLGVVDIHRLTIQEAVLGNKFNAPLGTTGGGESDVGPQIFNLNTLGDDGLEAIGAILLNGKLIPNGQYTAFGSELEITFEVFGVVGDAGGVFVGGIGVHTCQVPTGVVLAIGAPRAILPSGVEVGYALAVADEFLGASSDDGNAVGQVAVCPAAAPPPRR